MAYGDGNNVVDRGVIGIVEHKAGLSVVGDGDLDIDFIDGGGGQDISGGFIPLEDFLFEDFCCIKQ